MRRTSIAPSGGLSLSGISSFTFTFDVRTVLAVSADPTSLLISTSTSATDAFDDFFAMAAARVGLDEPLDGFDATRAPAIRRCSASRCCCSRRRAASRCCRASSSYRATVSRVRGIKSSGFAQSSHDLSRVLSSNVRACPRKASTVATSSRAYSCPVRNPYVAEVSVSYRKRERRQILTKYSTNSFPQSSMTAKADPEPGMRLKWCSTILRNRSKSSDILVKASCEGLNCEDIGMMEDGRKSVEIVKRRKEGQSSC